ncbi:MAG: TIM barrel protein [Planctomycetales bacterium]|nr:TIM barrel protein [Planctomycetales bacterium]
MRYSLNRRDFVAAVAATTTGLALDSTVMTNLYADEAAEPLFKISLAQWSLHRMLMAGKLDNLDFPSFTKTEFDINAVEYVNVFFKDKAEDTAYLTELKQRTADIDVTNVLIMVDGEGHLGDPDEAKRNEAVENHHKWVSAAKFLGCHSIRVNAHSEGSYEEQQKLAADGLRALAEFGAQHEIGIIVENHGGLSSNGKWLAGVIETVGLPNCGTLPDFGNFRTGENADGTPEYYDRYQGVAELMPFAKAVSAKSKEFDGQGNEVQTDFARMMKIVLDAGYHGYVGIEWEGEEPSEIQGTLLTRQLLERVRTELAG